MLPIISPDDLRPMLGDANIVLVDASNVPDAFNVYRQDHLENAVFIDLNKDLACPADAKFGGRHPLPSVDYFCDAISAIGISRNSHVVVYHRHFGANAAARFWWMLQAIGHEKVQVLDGGFDYAVSVGFPTSANTEKIIPGPKCEANEWQLPQADLEFVKQAVESKSHRVIDVREEGRYLGQFEPIDLVAGHIPSAVNAPYMTNLNDDGTFKTPSELTKKYQSVVDGFGPQNTIVHCGSGVTACHTLLAFAIAGLELPRLYVGSWSEWSWNQKL